MKITSGSNPLVKEVRSLQRKKNRRKKKSFIIEGIKIVEEALDHNYPLDNIIYTEDLRGLVGGQELYNRIVDLDISREIDRDIFMEISDTETPQGVMALARYEIKGLEDIVPSSGNYIILDGLQDPGNLGTIIRTADAFNLAGIIITEGTVDPYNPKVVRSTMGSIFRMDIYELDLEDIAELRRRGYSLLATRLEESRDIRELDFKNSLIVIGNESQGVSDEIFALADEFIRIDMPGKSESLNAAIAASIIMYESSK